MNNRIDNVGPDFINVSWNSAEYFKKRVHQIRVVAEPPFEPTPITIAIVNTSDSMCSLTKDIKPTTVYRVYIEEMTKPYAMHEVHYIVTPEGGKLTNMNKLHFINTTAN